MLETSEKWALIAILPAALILLVGHALEHDWVRTAAFALVTVFVGLTLWRRLPRST